MIWEDWDWLVAVAFESGRNCGAQEGLSMSKHGGLIGAAFRLWLEVSSIPGLIGSSSSRRNAAMVLHNALMFAFSHRSVSLVDESLLLWRFPPRLPRRLVLPVAVGTKSKPHFGSVGDCWSSARMLNLFAINVRSRQNACHLVPTYA